MGTAFRYAILMLLLGGLVYPLLITGLGQVLFPRQANGSLVASASGTLIGSELIAQNFTRPEYFHPRPSQNSYDASNSGGSNYGPTNKKLIDRVATDVAAFHKENPSAGQTVPVDAVTASGSGLDPDISLANAYAQAPRVATARHKDMNAINNLIAHQAEPKILGILGEPGINVFKLNLALDKIK